MGAFKKLAEDQAYKFFDKMILPFIVKEALVEGITNWQEKLPDWKFDIVYKFVENGGSVTVAEVLDICNFDRPKRLVDYTAGWVCT